MFKSAKACFKRVLKVCKPNIKEYELEAELTYNLIKAGAKRHAFQPIVASGKNACALHYNTNDDICNDGDMILMDFGVCYANYNSDTTRCFPVNGKFSARQKEVYSSVLRCLKEGSKLLKPGVISSDYEQQMANLVETELIKLGLLKADEVSKQDPEKPLYKKYFMHGTAHHIGLDVHDVGIYKPNGEPRLLEEGMCLTVEPGLYFGAWRPDVDCPERYANIGIRIEDDILVTSNGPDVLTKDCPKTISDLEAIIGKDFQ